MQDQLVVFDSCSVINALFNRMCLNNYIVFFDWNDTIWETYNDIIVFRNGNVRTAEDYNRVLRDDRCYGFYIIIESNEDSNDTISELNNLEIDTSLFVDKNKIEDKNTDIYELTYACIIKSKNQKLNTSRIIESFLMDNYNFILNKLNIYYVTGNICNVVQNLVFYKINKTIYYVPSRDDELYVQEILRRNNYSCASGNINKSCLIKQTILDISNIIKEQFNNNIKNSVC